MTRMPFTKVAAGKGQLLVLPKAPTQRWAGRRFLLLRGQFEGRYSRTTCFGACVLGGQTNPYGHIHLQIERVSLKRYGMAFLVGPSLKISRQVRSWPHNKSTTLVK